MQEGATVPEQQDRPPLLEQPQPSQIDSGRQLDVPPGGRQSHHVDLQATAVTAATDHHHSRELLDQASPYASSPIATQSSRLDESVLALNGGAGDAGGSGAVGLGLQEGATESQAEQEHEIRHEQVQEMVEEVYVDSGLEYQGVSLENVKDEIFDMVKP